MKNPIRLRTSLFQLFAVATVIAASSIFCAGQAFAPTKVAVIDTEAFSDAKTGITRLVNTMSALEREMKPRRDEIAGLKGQLDKIVKEIEQTGAIADPKTIEAKRDEAERLSRTIKLKSEDGQAILNRRIKEMTDPIYADIMTALEAYVKKRGIDLVLDVGKMGGAVMIANTGVDITAPFIAEYNAKPVTP